MLSPRLLSISHGIRLANSSGAKAIWYIALLWGPTGRSHTVPSRTAKRSATASRIASASERCVSGSK
jgi:hypothetical protein